MYTGYRIKIKHIKIGIVFAIDGSVVNAQGKYANNVSAYSVNYTVCASLRG